MTCHARAFRMMPGRRGLLGARRLGQLAFVGEAQAESEAGGEGFGEACIYDRWFLAKIERAVADTRLLFQHGVHRVPQMSAYVHSCSATSASISQSLRRDRPKFSAVNTGFAGSPTWWPPAAPTAFRIMYIMLFRRRYGTTLDCCGSCWHHSCVQASSPEVKEGSMHV